MDISYGGHHKLLELTSGKEIMLDHLKQLHAKTYVIRVVLP